MERLRQIALKIRTEYICNVFYWEHFGFIWIGRFKIDKEANINFKK